LNSEARIFVPIDPLDEEIVFAVLKFARATGREAPGIIINEFPVFILP
jgi:hypothetical protein